MWLHSASQPAVLLGVCIVIAHLPYLLGLFDPNPLIQQSGLGVGARPGLLPGNDTIDPNTGYTSQALAHLAASDWVHGRFPWWNPFEGLGAPLAGEMQCAAFFPLILLLLFSNGQVVLYFALGMIAGYSTYFLLRRLGLDARASFVGGVLFGLNGTFAWFRFAPSNPICFLPVLLLAVEWCRGRSQDGVRGPWWLVSLAIAFSIAAGFPETAYLDGLLALLWTVIRGRGLVRQALWRFLSGIALGGALGVVLAGPVLIAFLDYLPSALVGNHSHSFADVYIVTPGVGQFLFPYVYGPIFGFTSGAASSTLNNIWGSGGGYLTAAVVLVACLGVLGKEHRPLKAGLAAWSLLFMARSYGTPVAANIVNLLPGLSHIASYRYMDASVEFAVAVLASFGVGNVLDREIPRRVLLVPSALVCLVVVLGAKMANNLSRSEMGAAGWEKASLMWAGGTLVAILTVVTFCRFRKAGAFILLTLLPAEAIAMFLVPEFSAPRGGGPDTGVVSFLRSHLGPHRYLTIGPVFAPNYGSYYGLSTLSVNDLPAPKAFGELVQARLNSNETGTLFNGTSVIDPSGISPGEALVEGATTYERLGVKYVVTPSSENLLGSSPADFKLVYRDQLAAVYQLPHSSPFFQDHTAGCSLQPHGRDQVLVRCVRASTLLRDSLSMTGWTAQVDGRSVPMGTTKLHQQTVELPAGSSLVSFSFSPPHEEIALTAAGLALLACGLSAGGVRIGRRRGR